MGGQEGCGSAGKEIEDGKTDKRLNILVVRDEGRGR
jgi:hypothetical protein